MKKITFVFIIYFFSCISYAQNTPVYGWQEHFSYQNAKLLLETKNNIYCSSEYGLFYYNKETHYITRMNKTTGLSDVEITSLGYDEVNNIIILGYENGNIDIIKNNTIVNVPDIKLTNLLSKKKIKNVASHDGFAYLSCDFGLVVLDLINEEIKETYKIINNENTCEINDVKVSEQNIFIATSCGSYKANINSNDLNDYRNWDMISAYTDAKSIVEKNDSLLILHKKSSNLNGSIILWVDTIRSVYIDTLIKEISFSNNQTHRIYENSVAWSPGLNLSVSTNISSHFFENINYSIFSENQNIWVADSSMSLLKFSQNGLIENIFPEGPSSNNLSNIYVGNTGLLLCHETQQNSVSSSTDLISWEHVKNTPNIICASSVSNDFYYGSSSHSLFKVNETDTIQYNAENTNTVLDSSSHVSNIEIDNNGNLWGTLSYSGKVLFVKTLNDNWGYFWMPLVTNYRNIRSLVIDDFGQKWGAISGPDKGIFVLNDNETILYQNDDQYKVLTKSIGNGALPSEEVHCLAKDLGGNIWAGTSSGICVFYNPEYVFTEYNFDAQQIIIQDGDFGQYLLGSEVILSLAIDGGNRKWVGTLNSGVYLLSDDGTKEIYHFTEENSPLNSNTILNIKINQKTGVVFLHTEKGLMSFRNDATQGSEIQEKIKIFPNPVRENYNGIISIENLVYNSNVKITDLNGVLIHETFANGGTAVWNGTNVNGEKVHSGIYLILCSDKNGEEKIAGKILFIK